MSRQAEKNTLQVYGTFCFNPIGNYKTTNDMKFDLSSCIYDTEYDNEEPCLDYSGFNFYKELADNDLTDRFTNYLLGLDDIFDAIYEHLSNIDITLGDNEDEYDYIANVDNPELNQKIISAYDKFSKTIDGTYKYGCSPIVYFLKETAGTITQKYDGIFDVYEEPEYKLCGHICYEDETKENSIEINFGRDKGNIYLYENPIKIYDNDKKNIRDFLNKEAIDMFDTLIDIVNRTINDYLYSNKQILEKDIKSLYSQIYDIGMHNDVEPER